MPSPLAAFARALAAALFLGGALAACGGDGTTPKVAGRTLTATVVSPNGAEGAAVVQLSRPVASVSAVPGAQVFSSADGGSGTRVVVVRDQPGALRFTVTLADDVVPSATLVEVADGSNRLRPSLDGYRVTFAR